MLDTEEIRNTNIKLNKSLSRYIFHKDFPLKEMSMIQQEVFKIYRDFIININIHQYKGFYRHVLNEYFEIDTLLKKCGTSQGVQNLLELGDVCKHLKQSVLASIEESENYKHPPQGLSNNEYYSDTMGGKKNINKLQTTRLVKCICIVAPRDSEFESIANNYRERIYYEQSTKQVQIAKYTKVIVITYAMDDSIDDIIQQFKIIQRYVRLKGFNQLKIINMADGNEDNFGYETKPMMNRDKFLDSVFENFAALKLVLKVVLTECFGFMYYLSDPVKRKAREEYIDTVTSKDIQYSLKHTSTTLSINFEKAFNISFRLYEANEDLKLLKAFFYYNYV